MILVQLLKAHLDEEIGVHLRLPPFAIGDMSPDDPQVFPRAHGQLLR